MPASFLPMIILPRVRIPMTLAVLRKALNEREEKRDLNAVKCIHGDGKGQVDFIFPFPQLLQVKGFRFDKAPIGVPPGSSGEQSGITLADNGSGRQDPAAIPPYLVLHARKSHAAAGNSPAQPRRCISPCTFALLHMNHAYRL